MAGFQVSTYGRFWVSTEVVAAVAVEPRDLLVALRVASAGLETPS